MSPFSPSSRKCPKYGTAQAKDSQWERALALLDEMRSDGVAPNVISFNSAITACERAGRWEPAYVSTNSELVHICADVS